MKFLHCADLHLDSVFTANLSKDKAKERKSEQLVNFSKMMKFAWDEGCRGVIIAGDLYDKKVVSKTALNFVEGEIAKYPEMMVYYLRGNHDLVSAGEKENAPKNLKMFGNGEWTSYDIPSETGKNVHITGLELSKENAGTAYISLNLRPEDVNIVVLHGQESTYKSKDRAEVISIKALAGKGIDYLALGHIHEHGEDRIDARGCYVYPGCLEGRGFDEAGEHGFEMVEIDEASGEVHHRFVTFPGRRLFVLDTDISDCSSMSEVCGKISAAVAEENITSRDSVKIRLTGQVSIDFEIDTVLAEKSIEDDYYFVRVKDETESVVDYSAFRNDRSLKGEFARMTEAADNLSEEEKAEVIKLGLALLRGDEV